MSTQLQHLSSPDDYLIAVCPLQNECSRVTLAESEESLRKHQEAEMWVELICIFTDPSSQNEEEVGE